MGRKLVDISSSSLFVLKNVKKVVVSIAKTVAEKEFEECENTIIDTLCIYLYNAIKEQINKFKFCRPNQYRLMNMLASMLVGKVPNGAERICHKLKFNTKTIKGIILLKLDF